MVSEPSQINELVALLSVAGGIGKSASVSGFLPEFGGKSLLEWQICALQGCGVTSFLLEVDSVAGGLLALVDNLRETGLRIDFVRHVRDLADHLSLGTRLIIQAEAHYFAPAVIEKLLTQHTPFLATFDSREENAKFERIDLNTRWAGLGVIESKDVAALAGLPEGWSLTSLLLRHAIQSGARFVPVEQLYIEKGAIVVVNHQADVDMLTSQLLVTRREDIRGLIERRIFGPVAVRLAPLVWHSPVSLSALAGSSYAFASIGLACALLGWGVCALAAVFLALGAHTIGYIVIFPKDKKIFELLRVCSFWGLVGATVFSIVGAESSPGFDALFALVMVLGQCLLARRLEMPCWLGQFLQSPALLITALLFARIFSVFLEGALIIALVQLAMLLASQYLPARETKNNNQA